MMNNHSPELDVNFDESYFSSGAYADVSFDRYSQYWWSTRFYAMLVKKHGPESGRVLEVGCGLGHLLARLVDQYDVYGADINQWALKQAYRNVPKGKFLCLSIEDLRAFPDNFFQVVIAKHVAEHLSNPQLAIAEMSRVLKPSGFLLFSTPNTDSLARSVKKEMWIGYQDPTHINLLSPQEWIGILRSNQLSPRKVFSDGFWDVPYVSWLPDAIQKVIFGAPGGLQAIFGLSIIPLRMGESLIILADQK
jgi:ubiquinone/menaquinone biosynthesis C-methylase UbiE